MMILSFGKKFPQALSRIQRCNVLIIGNTGVATLRTILSGDDAVIAKG